MISKGNTKLSMFLKNIICEQNEQNIQNEQMLKKSLIYSINAKELPFSSLDFNQLSILINSNEVKQGFFKRNIKEIFNFLKKSIISLFKMIPAILGVSLLVFAAKTQIDLNKIFSGEDRIVIEVITKLLPDKIKEIYDNETIIDATTKVFGMFIRFFKVVFGMINVNQLKPAIASILTGMALIFISILFINSKTPEDLNKKILAISKNKQESLNVMKKYFNILKEDTGKLSVLSRLHGFVISRLQKWGLLKYLQNKLVAAGLGFIFIGLGICFIYFAMKK